MPDAKDDKKDGKKDANEKASKTTYVVAGNVKVNKTWHTHGSELQLSPEDFAKLPAAFKKALKEKGGE